MSLPPSLPLTLFLVLPPSPPPPPLSLCHFRMVFSSPLSRSKPCHRPDNIYHTNKSEQLAQFNYLGARSR